MLYVVGGFMRTGTSMMMRACLEGGMDVAARASREEMRLRFADDDYDPNVDGLWELDRADYTAFDFPRQFDGKVLKALNRGPLRMAVMPNGIRVVFMRRHTEEIEQSYQAFFNQRLGLQAERFERNMGNIVERIRNRRDVYSCHVFWYRELLQNPLSHFQTLARAGWPMDAEKAATIPDQSRCRYRIECLEVGVR